MRASVERQRKSQKGKGKAKAAPKKARKEHEERDGSSAVAYEMLSIPSFTDVVFRL
jgi:hypothetical protein